MKTSTRFLLITLGIGLPASVLAPIIFPPHPAAPTPGPALLPLFAVLIGVESLFFGAGVAFLVMGLPVMRKVASISGVSPWPSFLSLAFMAVSWWPHLGMHRVVGMDLMGVLAVDYFFHLPYILAAGVVAHFFVATTLALLGQDTSPAYAEAQSELLEVEVEA